MRDFTCLFESGGSAPAQKNAVPTPNPPASLANLWRSTGSVLLLALGQVAAANAQQHSGPDTARVEIRTTLRSYYFSLAHHDWDALTADILAAKVVAHRPAPEKLLASAAAAASHGTAPTYCASDKPRVDDSDVLLDGDWAEVSVPHCRGSDEFRLIHFEHRWRIVYSRISSTPSIK
jgi:hypothetical protein